MHLLSAVELELGGGPARAGREGSRHPNALFSCILVSCWHCPLAGVRFSQTLLPRAQAPSRIKGWGNELQGEGRSWAIFIIYDTIQAKYPLERLSVPRVSKLLSYPRAPSSLVVTGKWIWAA